MKKLTNKRLLIAAGGTGGHLYPAQALAEQLLEAGPDLKIQFASGGLSTTRHFDRSKYLFREISCGRIRFFESWKILKGFYEANRFLKQFNPDLVVGFGSYHTFPLLAAAVWQKKPLILHAADTIPGKVIRLFSPFSKETGIHFSETAKYLSGKTTYVGLPLRKGFRSEKPSREQGANYFGLQTHYKTLLVMGGSQGARAINELLVAAAPKIKTRPLQILHFAGQTAKLDSIRDTYKRYGIKHYVQSYESRMEYAWALADLAITRSGASSIAEQLSFSVPGILIPYPVAADDHQKLNALEVQKTYGGVKIFYENTLKSNLLAEEIDHLITHPLPFSSQRKAPQDFSNLVFQYLMR